MLATLSALLAGVLTWSLTEYVLHRWLGHDPRTRPNAFESEHTLHHAVGNYFAPSWKKGLTAVAVTAVLAAPAVWGLGAVPGMAYVFGFVGAYAGYEVMHRRDHTHAGFGAYGRYARRHHFYHHFVDPKSNHGVTSPLWDWVFGTLRRPEVIPVPPKLAMPWLVDPRTGTVRAEHAAHYELLKRR